MRTNNLLSPPSLTILPEDNHYKSLALGFRRYAKLESDIISIKNNCRGWLKTFGYLQKYMFKQMRKQKSLHILLMIDFDKYRDERVEKLSDLPVDLKERIFLIGCHKDSEAFKRTLGGGRAEKIGYEMAVHCFGAPNPGAENPWLSPEWIDNLSTVEQLRRIFGKRLLRC